MKQVSTIIKHTFYKFWEEPATRIVARRELEEAKRLYLSNQTAAEYHTQMNIVYKNKIKRLEEFLAEEEQ